MATRQTGGIEALLVHSPLVGPSTMRPLAAALSLRGWSTTVPDVRSAARTPREFSTAAAQSVPAADIVIGHSGAGAMLPSIAARVGARCSVFVDAVVPGESTSFRPAQRFIDFVDTLPVHEGLLPEWHRWWPTETVNQLVPDEALRQAVLDEIPALPRSFYDEAIELPPEWWTRPAAYLQLSPAYAEELAWASQHGWPTAHRSGRHLDLVTHPVEVADEVIELVARAR